MTPELTNEAQANDLRAHKRELTNEAANDLRAHERIASYCHIKYD